jgi:hypothetical protein
MADKHVWKALDRQVDIIFWLCSLQNKTFTPSRNLLLCFLLSTGVFWCPANLAADLPASPSIHRSIYFNHEQKELTELDRNILLELIKLSRFNASFRLEANYHWAGRSIVYPLAQECGTAAIFSNNIVDLSQRARGLDDPGLISIPSRKRGLESAITGAAVNGTSSAAELAQNAFVAWQARQHGFSPGRSITFVRTSLKTLDDLLSKREGMLGAYENGDSNSVTALEGRLLRHVRNQLLFEFKTWSVASRETEWRENTFYSIDTARNFTSMSASILSLAGFSDKNLRGNAAITSLTANSLATLNPLIRDLAAVLMQKHQERKLAKLFPQDRPRTIDQLRHDWNDLEDLMSAATKDPTDKRFVSEIAFLIKSSQVLDESLASEETRIQRLRRVAAQQAIAGPIIGLAGLARSICNTVSYFGYRSNSLVVNRINFAGQISQTTGQAYSLIATPKAAISHAIYRQRLARTGKLPSQILKARLARLDGIETQIRNTPL